MRLVRVLAVIAAMAGGVLVTAGEASARPPVCVFYAPPGQIGGQWVCVP